MITHTKHTAARTIHTAARTINIIMIILSGAAVVVAVSLIDVVDGVLLSYYRYMSPQ